MTTPRTRQAYFALYEIFDRALASGTGIRMQLESHSAAVNLRMRLHAARQVDRETNRQVYAPGMPLYDASQYDVLEIVLRVVDNADGPCWLLIKPRVPALIGTIEPITPNPEDFLWTTSPAPSLAPADPRQITHQPEAAPSFQPSPTSPTGTKPTKENSDSSSESPNADSSSPSSTKPESEPRTPALRRL